MTSACATVHHTNGLQNQRALTALIGLTGNWDVPGGNVVDPETWLYIPAGVPTREKEFTHPRQRSGGAHRSRAERRLGIAHLAGDRDETPARAATRQVQLETRRADRSRSPAEQAGAKRCAAHGPSACRYDRAAGCSLQLRRARMLRRWTCSMMAPGSPNSCNQRAHCRNRYGRHRSRSSRLRHFSQTLTHRSR